MDDNILPAAGQSESPQEEGTSVPLSSQETEMFVDPDHPGKVLEGLNRLWLNGTLCDVILCCEEQEFPCHRYVLASFSSYFEAMFAPGMRESTQERVTISGVEPQMIALMVNYAYTSEVSISTANVQALLAASNMLDVMAVRKACGDFTERCIDMNNCEDRTSVPLSSQETEVFVDPHHPSKVLEGLNRLRLNSTLCDVILCCEEQEFPCHRYALASICSYFEAMFTSGMKESTQERVTISGVEPQMIGLMVNYAYTSKVSISTANVQALLVASNLLDIAAVQKACCDFMERRMDTSNCVGIYCFSEDHSCKMLEKHSLDYILEHFSAIYQQQEFPALSEERLVAILASDHLNVPKEDMVFEAAMLWLDQCPTRRQNFEKVLEQIRLPLISPPYLPTVIKSLDVVKEYQGCQKFISEAKDRPYRNKKQARPRRTSVIVTVGMFMHVKRFYKVQSFDPLNDEWMTLGYLPFDDSGYAVVASGSTMYVAGCGYMWRFDVHHQNSWLKLAPMNFPRKEFSLVVLDEYVFAVSGHRGRGTEKTEDSIDRYDPKTNTWQLMESVGVAAASSFVAPTVVALDGWLYFFGIDQVYTPAGGTLLQFPKTNFAQVFKYKKTVHTQTSVWTEVAPMRIPRGQPAACVLNGKIYVTGGWHRWHVGRGRYQEKLEDSMECYNPETNRWTMRASMEQPRFEHNLVAMDGKIYAVGGLRSKNGLARKIESYCEATNEWTTVGEMPEGGCYGFTCLSLRLSKAHVPKVVEDDDTTYYFYDRSDSSEDESEDEYGYGYTEDEDEY